MWPLSGTLLIQRPNSPRTPSHWPTPAATRSWPHFHRVCPILAIQLAKGTRFSCILPDNGHKQTGSSTNRPHTCHPTFVFSAIDGDDLLPDWLSSRLTLACLSPSLSHTHTQPTKQKPHSATLSTAVVTDRPWATAPPNSQRTGVCSVGLGVVWFFFKKLCYPETKALRTAVGEFFAYDSRSFTASKNSGGKQKTYFCSGKEGGCEALLDYLYYQYYYCTVLPLIACGVLAIDRVLLLHTYM